jgi:hypothetical protein
MTDAPEKQNVVDLAQARKRQKTVRVDGFGRPKDRERKGASSGKVSVPRGKLGRVFAWVQLLLFLFLVAYLMRLCSHR